MNKNKKKKKSEILSNSYKKNDLKIESLPDGHRMLAKREFKEFHSSLNNFNRFNDIDDENRSILTFGIYLIESLLYGILCSGLLLENLHELEKDIYSYLDGKRQGIMNLNFKVISTEKKGFTLLPLDFKGFKKSDMREYSEININNLDMDNDFLVPPKEYLDIIGYKESITKAAVFQFPYNGSPEEIINGKCIIDIIRRRIEDKEWLEKLDKICEWLNELVKVIRHLVKHYPITYKKFCKETGGEIFLSIKFPLLYMSLMKILFDEYPNITETNEELNPRDPGDGRRLINRIRRNKLAGMRLIDIISRISLCFGSVIDIMGGSRLWRCESIYVQYYLHMSFVFDNSTMFSQLAEKSYMFDHDIFEWKYTLNSLAQHIPLLNSFLRPLATSIMSNRVRNRLIYYNKNDNISKRIDNNNNEYNMDNEDNVIFPILGNSLEARFLTNEVMNRSKAFFGKFEGERLINSVKKEFDNWQYRPIRCNREINNLAIKKTNIDKTLKEYDKLIFSPEKKIRHIKSAINNAIPPLSHFSEGSQLLKIRIAPGQKYVQSFYNNKANIPLGMIIK